MTPLRYRLGSPLAAVTITIISGAAGACLPIPHTERVSPALSGVLRNPDGTGAQAVTIATSCIDPRTRTTTDSSGHFTLPEVTRHASWLPLMGDRVFSYGICALEGDSGTVIYHWESLAAPPRSEAVECISTLRPVPMTTCRRRP